MEAANRRPPRLPHELPGKHPICTDAKPVLCGCPGNRLNDVNVAEVVHLATGHDGARQHQPEGDDTAQHTKHAVPNNHPVRPENSNRRRLPEVQEKVWPRRHRVTPARIQQRGVREHVGGVV